MNLQPLDDRIVVKPSEAEATTASGLVIPDTAKDKPQQGEVLAVGPGRRSESSGELIPMDEKVYSWWSYRARDWRKANRGRRLDHFPGRLFYPRRKSFAPLSSLFDG